MSKQTKTSHKDNIDFDITKFTLLWDLLLVKALRPNTSKDDALIDPAQYEDKPEFGEVIKIGDGAKLILVNESGRTMVVGDIVRFGKYSTEAIRTKGADYFIVHAEDVSAVL